MSLAKQRKSHESPLDRAIYEFKSIGKDCVIWPGAKIVGAEHITLGNAVMIDELTFLNIKAPLFIGDFVHIGAYSSIGGGASCDIDAFTSLSWGVRIFTSTENLGGLFGPMIPSDLRQVIHAPVYIGRHVLIGANSVILPGATIHNGAVIGAGSVVRGVQEISPWSIWGGAPASYIKGRDRAAVFEAEQELRERYYGQV